MMTDVKTEAVAVSAEGQQNEKQTDKKNIKIKSLEFVAGDKKESEGLKKDLKNITVLVGPNNAGKSLTLKEIEAFLDNKNEDKKLVKKIELDNMPLSSSELREKVLIFECKRDDGRLEYKKESSTHTYYFNESNYNDFDNRRDEEDKEKIFKSISGLFVNTCNAEQRFALSQDKQCLHNDGEKIVRDFNAFTALVYQKEFSNQQEQETSNRQELDKIIHSMFDLYPCFDHRRGDLSIIMSKEQMPDYHEETNDNPNDKTLQIYNNGTPISSMGDGIKCIVGLVIGVLASPSTIMLIDEPEAFCSPPKARQLGRVLSQIAKARDISLIVATHSAQFLLGCLDEAQDDTSVIRLTYNGDFGTTHGLESKEIQEIAKNPVLKHSHVIQAMFHSAVIITDSDDTRIMNETLASRLDKNKFALLQDAHFLNRTGGITALPPLIKPLKNMNIPTAVITGFSFLTGDLETIKKIINACAGNDQNSPLITKCQSIGQNLKGETSKEGAHLDKISDSVKKEVLELIEDLEEYGLFILPIDNQKKYYLLPEQELNSKTLKNFLDTTTDRHKEIQNTLIQIDKWIKNFATQKQDTKTYHADIST